MAVKKKQAPKKPAKKVVAKKSVAGNSAKAVVKKPASKKTTKPAAKKPTAKPVAKKASPKPASKKVAKPTAKKPAALPIKAIAKKPVAPAKPAAKTVVAKSNGGNLQKPVAKPTAKHAIGVKSALTSSKPTAASKTKITTSKSAIAAKPALASTKPAIATKPAPAPVKPLEQPVAPLKKGAFDPKSLVSIKQKVKPVIKKEPPKPTKVVIPKTTIKSSVKYEPEFTKSVLDANRLQASLEGPTQRYSDIDLAEFKEIIMRKLDAAKKELNYLGGLITRKDEGGDMDDARYMTMEDGSVSMEREQLSQMASRQITFIDHLEKAMMRIENKTYGICRVTGKLIDKARLRAVPHATLSIEAKQLMSK